MDFRKFKKVGETKTHTVLEHPEGHIIHIKHAALDNKHKKDLKQIKMAEGGKVPQRPQPAPQPDDKIKQLEGSLKKAFGLAKGGKVIASSSDPKSSESEHQRRLKLEKDVADLVDRHNRGEFTGISEEDEKQYNIRGYADGGAVSDSDSLERGISSEPQGHSIMDFIHNASPTLTEGPSEPAIAPAPQQEIQDDYGKIGQAEADIQNIQRQQGIQQQLGDVEAQKQQGIQNIEQQKIALDNHLAQESDRIMREEAKELQAARDDMNNGHFHPKDIFTNKSTWGQVRTGIGLILGGIASNSNGGRNPVLDMLQRQIDRDAEAGGNLYKALEKKYGSQREALNMAKIYKTGALLDQLELEAAKAASPQAKLNAQMAISQLQTDMNARLADHARNQALARLQSNPNIDATTKIGQRIINDPNIAQAQKTDALKELDTVSGAQAAEKDIRDTFSQLKKIHSLSASIPFSKANTDFKVLNAKLLSSLRANMKGQGALSDQEQKTVIEPLLAGKFDRPEQLDKAEEAMLSFINNKVAGSTGTLKALGIQVPGAKQQSGGSKDFGFKRK